MLIDGIHIPLTTPFTPDGASYLRKLEYNVGRYSLTPAAGLVALTGEGSVLSDEETCQTLRVVSETAAVEKVLIAAVARDSVRRALHLAEESAQAGFDAILLTAPFHWQALTNAELSLFFTMVADASPLPILLGSDGAHAGCSLPVAMIGALSRHGNVLGVYDAELNVSRYREIAGATREAQREVVVTMVFSPVTRRMAAAAKAATMVTAAALTGGSAVFVSPASTALKTRTKKVGFQIMAAGGAMGTLEVLEAGAAGAMPCLAASAPQACYEVYAAFKDGDPALAAEKQQRLAEADALIQNLGIAGVKYGCDLNGYFGGGVRLPRLGLNSAERNEVQRVLSGLRN
jgi:4-hydroxy-2-oxoglutarate aldolase